MNAADSFLNRADATALTEACRICVVGMGGKTSFSRALGAANGLPVIHHDEIGWMPRWTVRDKDEQIELMRQQLESCADGWVADGNLSLREAELFLPQADMVIWLHTPYVATWWKITQRSFQRALHRKRICGDNYETFPHILGRHSMIWWVLFHWHRSHRKIRATLESVAHNAKVIRLTSYRELNAAYDAIDADPAEFRAP